MQQIGWKLSMIKNNSGFKQKLKNNDTNKGSNPNTVKAINGGLANNVPCMFSFFFDFLCIRIISESVIINRISPSH